MKLTIVKVVINQTNILQHIAGYKGVNITMPKNRTPIRTCIGCRSKFPQKTLIRFVCNTGQILEIEGSKKLPGRSAYICHSISCIEKAFKAPKRINALLQVQLSKSAISEFQQTLIEKEKITDEKKETAN